MEEENGRELANAGSPGKRPLKWRHVGSTCHSALTPENCSSLDRTHFQISSAVLPGLGKIDTGPRRHAHPVFVFQCYFSLGRVAKNGADFLTKQPTFLSPSQQRQYSTDPNCWKSSTSTSFRDPPSESWRKGCCSPTSPAKNPGLNRHPLRSGFSTTN